MTTRRSRLRDRATGDLLVLMVTGTVCGVVVVGGIGIVLIEIFHPESNTDAALRTIAGIVNTLIGLLAGFLAGKTGSLMVDERRKEDEDQP